MQINTVMLLNSIARYKLNGTLPIPTYVRTYLYNLNDARGNYCEPPTVPNAFSIHTYACTYVRTGTQNDIETNVLNLLSLYIFFWKVLQILLSNEYSPVLWSNCFVDQCPSWGFPLICSSRRVVLGRWQRGTAEAEWSLRNKSKHMNKNSPWRHIKAQYEKKSNNTRKCSLIQWWLQV